MAGDVIQHRHALVLAGGGARGAYEAGVLSHLFEHVYPRLPPEFEFDIFSGTSLGAVHATYAAATAMVDPGLRAKRLLKTWTTMRLGDVLRLTLTDLLAMPLRALGLWCARSARGGHHTMGGLIDVSPLEKIVDEQIPWARLPDSLRSSPPRVLCVSCTEVRTGRATLFLDGLLSDSELWSHDPNARAISTRIDSRHVRASAAIPFLFPAVLIDDRFYVDGGLRMNTPLSPALRLSADRVLVVSLKKRPEYVSDTPPYPDEIVARPAFLLGKVLDALTLDQLDYEIQRLELVNALIARGEEIYGCDFLARVNPAVREQRGTGYRKVATAILRPSEDLGALAAECHRRAHGSRHLGLIAALVTQATRHGLPDGEADLLSYLLFDHSYTKPLVDLGRADAKSREDDLVSLLSGGGS